MTAFYDYIVYMEGLLIFLHPSLFLSVVYDIRQTDAVTKRNSESNQNNSEFLIIVVNLDAG